MRARIERLEIRKQDLKVGPYEPEEDQVSGDPQPNSHTVLSESPCSHVLNLFDIEVVLEMYIYKTTTSIIMTFSFY